jgi:hypothetical protein
VSIRHESPAPCVRRNHGTPGSFGNPETSRGSRQLVDDIGEMMSAPTGNRQLVHDYDTARQAPTSVDNSVGDHNPQVMRTLPFCDNHKRSTDDWDRDPSWLAQQKNEVTPDISHNVHGRKMSRSESNAMVHDINAFSAIVRYQELRCILWNNPRDLDHDVCVEYQEDQVRSLNRPNTRWRARQSRASAYSVKKTAQSSAAGRSESPYAVEMLDSLPECEKADSSQESGDLYAEIENACLGEEFTLTSALRVAGKPRTSATADFDIVHLDRYDVPEHVDDKYHQISR